MKTFANLSISLLSIFLTLVMIELLFRLVSAFSEKEVARTDRPHADYMPRHATKFRDYVYPDARGPNTLRIVTVGDSFTYAGNVELPDSYSKRLEWLMNQLPPDGRKVEVIKAGLPGRCSVDEVEMVHNFINEYHPDVILLQIFLNDPDCDPAVHSFKNAMGFMNDLKKWPIFSYWKSGAFVVDRLYNSKSQRVTKQYYEDIFADPENWDRFSKSIQEMKEISSKSSVKFAAFLFPTFSFPLTEDAYPFLSIHRKVAALFKELNTPFLDLFPFYRNIPAERLEAVVDVDPHPNEIAHRIAATAIYNWIERIGLWKQPFGH